MKPTRKQVFGLVVVAAGLVWLLIRLLTVSPPPRVDSGSNAAAALLAPSGSLDAPEQRTESKEVSRSTLIRSDSLETESPQGLNSRLVFLSMSDGTPAAGSGWRFRDPVTEKATRESIADAQGCIGIAPGQWEIESTSANWTSTIATIDVAPGSSRVVWVQGSG
jgi:hypothetical protein